MYTQDQAALQDQLRRQQMEQASAIRMREGVVDAIPAALSNLWAMQQADRAALAKRDAERRRYIEANRAREQEMAFRAEEAEKARQEKRSLMEREYKLRRRLKRSGARGASTRSQKRLLKLLDESKKLVATPESIPRAIAGRKAVLRSNIQEVARMEAAGQIPPGWTPLLQGIAAGIDAPGSRFKPTDPADLRAQDLKDLRRQAEHAGRLLATAKLSSAKGESAPYAIAGQAEGAHKDEIERLQTNYDNIQEELRARSVRPTSAPVQTQSAPPRTPYWDMVSGAGQASQAPQIPAGIPAGSRMKVVRGQTFYLSPDNRLFNEMGQPLSPGR
tara:strand:+ start:403 stop:1395 length:993 start_codon:yes stop_codon:yes gene_type:complete